MLKEAFICGIGMAIDLAGGHYAQSQPESRECDRIAVYWQSVGGLLQFAIHTEGPKIEAESRQLQFNLDTVEV